MESYREDEFLDEFTSNASLIGVWRQDAWYRLTDLLEWYEARIRMLEEKAAPKEEAKT